jgi:hypothetical protein
MNKVEGDNKDDEERDHSADHPEQTEASINSPSQSPQKTDKKNEIFNLQDSMEVNIKLVKHEQDMVKKVESITQESNEMVSKEIENNFQKCVVESTSIKLDEKLEIINKEEFPQSPRSKSPRSPKNEENLVPGISVSPKTLKNDPEIPDEFSKKDVLESHEDAHTVELEHAETTNQHNSQKKEVTDVSQNTDNPPKMEGQVTEGMDSHDICDVLDSTSERKRTKSVELNNEVKILN